MFPVPLPDKIRKGHARHGGCPAAVLEAALDRTKHCTKFAEKGSRTAATVAPPIRSLNGATLLCRGCFLQLVSGRLSSVSAVDPVRVSSRPGTDSAAVAFRQVLLTGMALRPLARGDLQPAQCGPQYCAVSATERGTPRDEPPSPNNHPGHRPDATASARLGLDFTNPGSLSALFSGLAQH